MEYDPTTETYHVTHDWAEAASVSSTILEAMAEIEEDHLTGNPPLFDVVDPDALDALFQPTSDDQPRRNGRVPLRFSGRLVSLHASGEIVIEATGARAID